MLKKIPLLGIGITNETENEILEYILESLHTHRKKLFIATPNPEIVVYANNHLDYKDKLNSADISLPDGVGVFIACGLLGDRLKERIPGVDFMEAICERMNGKPVSIGLLGGRKGVAERAAERLLEKYPELKIGYVGEEWGDGIENGELRMENKTTERRTRKKLSTFNFQLSTSIDILFVAFGFPKQEEWIFEHLDKIPVKVAMGVGGAFDYVSGSVPRAPYLIRAAGFEWLYRLIRQPWRIKRQLALGEFVYLVVRELVRKYRK